MPGGTQDSAIHLLTFMYRALTFFGRLSHTFPLVFQFHVAVLQPHLSMVWAAPISLATTLGMISFPLGTKMFQFPRFPSVRYIFTHR